MKIIFTRDYFTIWIKLAKLDWIKSDLVAILLSRHALLIIDGAVKDD